MIAVVVPALAAVERGELVACAPEEWPVVRRALQDRAGRWIEQRQDIRAILALREVQRLDARFHYPLGAP